MRQDEVISYPVVGEFYAFTQPQMLALARCAYVDAENHSNWVFSVWTPFGRNQWTFVPPAPIRRLWYSRYVYLGQEEAQKHRVGSVYLAKKADRLFFIGPLEPEQREHAKTTVRILANWDANHDAIGYLGDNQVVELFQSGPEREPEDEQHETRFDKAVR